MDWALYYQDLEKFNQKQREKHEIIMSDFAELRHDFSQMN
jgi:hypothetical protein